MDFLKKVFGFSTEPQKSLAAKVPKGRSELAAGGSSLSVCIPAPIPYDPALVAQLKAEHAELFKRFVQIRCAAEQANFEELPALLESLRTELRRHLTLENINFYGYLKQCLAQDEKALAFMSKIKTEMDTRARIVLRFADQYATHPLCAEQLAGFQHELALIDDALLKRITQEEARLYLLYQPYDRLDLSTNPPA